MKSIVMNVIFQQRRKMEEKEKSPLLPPRVSLGEKVAEFLGGLGMGVTALLLFGLLWIPVVAVLLAEYRWLIK